MAAARVVVVGGGIAGLTTAYQLQKLARERSFPLELTLLERDAGVGGKVRSSREQGYLFEAGPNGFLDNEPASLRLVDELDLRDRLLRSNDAARNRFVYRGNKMHRLEMHPLKFMSSGLLSWGGKFRVAKEYFVPARQEEGDESVASFGRRRLGDEFTEVLLDSMVSGIFAANIDKLSLHAAFPKMPAMESEYGGLFRALKAKKRESTSGPAGPMGAVLHTFRDGMAELPRALEKHLARAIQTYCPADALVAADDALAIVASGVQWKADAIVLATPAPDSARVIEEYSGEAAAALSQIRFAGIHVIYQAYRPEQIKADINGFGVLIPRNQNHRLLGTIWSSSTFDGQAPAGTVLLRHMIGGDHDPAANDLSNEELLAIARAEAEPLFGIQGEPLLERYFRWNEGIPQYDLGHLDRVARARAALPDGIFLTGNSVAGIGFNHCANHAETIASEVFDYLTRGGHKGVAG
jgi:oxygen-dependent protoporphyrinogen oxidase